MWSIAICDNDSEDLQMTQANIQAWLAARSCHAEIATFSEAKRLLERLDADRRYDLYVLDILMPQISGIELGRQIRAQDGRAQIIYTTSSRDFALDAYVNRACDYLLKPLEQIRLFETMDRAWADFGSRNEREQLGIRGRTGISVLEVSDILYVENIARTPTYFLKNGDCVRGVVNRKTFDEAVAPLPNNPMFLSPHKSYWVNMRYIHAIVKDEVELYNGIRLPISRRQAAEVNQRYLKYLADGGMIEG